MNKLDLMTSDFAEEESRMMSALKMGRAIGAMEVLNHLQSALSDGTRKGSSECASELRKLDQYKGQMNEQFAIAAEELGMSVRVLREEQKTICIEGES